MINFRPVVNCFKMPSIDTSPVESEPIFSPPCTKMDTLGSSCMTGQVRQRKTPSLPNILPNIPLSKVEEHKTGLRESVSETQEPTPDSKPCTESGNNFKDEFLRHQDSFTTRRKRFQGNCFVMFCYLLISALT